MGDYIELKVLVNKRTYLIDKLTKIRRIINACCKVNTFSAGDNVDKLDYQVSAAQKDLEEAGAFHKQMKDVAEVDENNQVVAVLQLADDNEESLEALRITLIMVDYFEN